MEQITLEEVKELCGCEENNEFANMLSLCMVYAAMHNINCGHKESGKMMYEKSHNIYAKLKEIGYYDDVKGVF